MILMIQRTTRMPAMTKKALRASATMAWASRSLMLHFPHGAVRWPPGGVTRPPGALAVTPRRLSTPCSQVNRIPGHAAALRLADALLPQPAPASVVRDHDEGAAATAPIS